MAKVAKKVSKNKPSQKSSPKSTKPAPARKPLTPAPKSAPKSKPAPKPAAKAPAKPAPKIAPKPATPPAKPSKPAATPPKASPVITKPAPGKPAAPAKPAPSAKAPPAAVATKPAPAAKPLPATPGKPATPANSKTSKKAAKNAPPGKPVISAKPGQILLTPLKPTGATPATFAAASKTPAPPVNPLTTDSKATLKSELKKIKPAPVVPPPLPPAPVTSDSKAKKNQAGLLAKELDFYRELLLTKRREIVGDMSSMEREALRGTGSNLSNLPVHMADMGTDNYEQEFTLGLVEKDRHLLKEINQALAKIQNGTYGICEGTGKPISKARLEAQPWSKFSIEHVRSLESRNFRR